MTIITAAAMALLLASDPAPAPAEEAPATAAPAPQPEAPAAVPAPLAAAPAPAPAALQATPAAVGMVAPVAGPELAASVAPGMANKVFLARHVRAGLGVSVTDADKGFASNVQVGVQLDPWDLLGFRAGAGMTTSVVGAGGWDAAEFSGSVVVHPLGLGRRVEPYVGAGVQLAFLAIFPDGAPLPSGNLLRLGSGHLGVSMMGAATEGSTAQNGFGGTSQFKVMPEATVGALFRITPRLSLDAAARYQPLFWNGSTYHGLSVIAAVATPF